MPYSLEDCPACRGVGSVQHENGWCVYIDCLDCGAHTAEIAYENEAERELAEQAAVRLWNMGKVIRPDPGE